MVSEESRALRVAVADDAVLLREGVAQILKANGHEVVASLGSAAELLEQIHGGLAVDAVVLDIRMPPTHTDEGIVALEELRASGFTAGVLLLSTYAVPAYAVRALGSGNGTGYLLKDRVSDSGTLVAAVERVAAGESVVDPEVVSLLVAERTRSDGLDHLTEREREVLTLMAEGRSNSGIASALVVSLKTVEAHISRILAKLGLEDSPADHRRVLAVVRWLEHTDV
ncbi:response regulator transcription factor [Plantibacter flavus]|uniref:LuxR C-terminal-related transcriptional regulator n=1 Tax=Plantibacter flavus TaxID=150123 RepID=UPI003F170B48